MSSFIFSKTFHRTRLESLPGWFWSLGLMFGTRFRVFWGGGFAEKKCMNLSKLEKHHWHINSVYSHVPNHMYIFISEKCVRQHLHFEFLARVLLSALYSSCYMLPFSPASYWLCWCQGCYGCEVCGFLSNWPTFEAFLQVELFLSMSSCCVWKLPIYPKNHKSQTPACRLR